MITRREDHLFLIVNAACKAADIRHLVTHIGHRCTVRADARVRHCSRCRGPKGRRGARTARCRHRHADVHDRQASHARRRRLLRHALGLHRRGRLRDLGAGRRPKRWRARCSRCPRSSPPAWARATRCGWKPGLCLYGHDIDTTTTPVEAGLTWAIQKVRRAGGARHGGYPGVSAIDAQLASGPSTQARRPGRPRARAGARRRDHRRRRRPQARPRHQRHARPDRRPADRDGLPRRQPRDAGHEVYAEVRGKRQPMRVSAMPFTPHRYFRGLTPFLPSQSSPTR